MVVIFEVIDIKSKKFLSLEILGAFVVSAMAVIFHSLYELSNRNLYVGLISATNESVFEHVKIIFYPYIIWTLVEYFLLKPKDYKRFFTAKLIVNIVISSLVIVFYYTYVGVIGYNIMAVDIGSAFVYVIIGFIWSYNWITNGSYGGQSKYLLSIAVFFVSLFAITYFSISPPKLPLFYDTEREIYGMN